MLDEIGSRLDIFSHNVWLAYPSCRSAFDVAPQLTLSWVLRLLLDDAHLNSRQQQQQQQEQGPGEQQQPNPSIVAAAALLPGRKASVQHTLLRAAWQRLVIPSPCSGCDPQPLQHVAGGHPAPACGTIG